MDDSELKTTKTDIVVSVSKGLVGIVPLAGGILSEIVGSVIPNQRIDRIVKVLSMLEKKLESVAMLDERLKSPEFVDLIEDGLFQAARASSDVRRDEIASLIKNGISRDDLDLTQKKKLLAILGDLNDIEVLILNYHSLELQREKQQEFETKHSKVIFRPIITMGSSQEEIDKAAIHETYQSNLVRLGLLKPEFKSHRKNELPEFDNKTGMLKVGYYRITHLGTLLLRYLDLLDEVQD